MKVQLASDTSPRRGFITWQRLSYMFRAGKEIQTNETLTDFEIDESGISYGVRQIGESK